MKAWELSVRVVVPDDVTEGEVEDLVSDTVGNEVYNRYGEGNAYTLPYIKAVSVPKGSAF